MSETKIEVPELIELVSCGGDWHMYIETIYSIFEEDFIHSKPSFNGTRLQLKYHPEVDGKAYTFYHMTHSGTDENERIPDLRRCERIGWAKPTIEKNRAWNLKVWPQVRHGKNRLCIWLEQENELDYFVILDVREKYILPWTTFVAEYNHQRRKMSKEYEDYIKKGIRNN